MESLDEKTVKNGGVYGPVDEALVSLELLGILRTEPGPVAVICGMLSYAERLDAELNLLGKEFEVSAATEGRILPEGSTRMYAVGESDSPRAELLSQVLKEPPRVVLTSAIGLFSPAPSPEKVRGSELTLKRGMTIAPEELVKRLLALDYDDEAEVVTKGEFAKRGGIVDVYSPSEELPARVEFFGDEIDSIRIFHPENQKSCGTAEEYRVILRSGSPTAGQQGGESDFSAYLQEYSPCIVVVYEQECRKQLERFGTNEEENGAEKWERFLKSHKGNMIRIADAAEMAGVGGDGDKTKNGGGGTAEIYPVSGYLSGAVPEGAEEQYSELSRQLSTGLIRQWLAGGREVVALGQSDADCGHMESYLRENGIRTGGKNGVRVETGRLPGGLFLPEKSLAVITEQELFSTPKRIRNGRMPKKMEVVQEEPEGRADAFSEISEGDYAVHVHFGICIYRGLRVIQAAGVKQEVLALEFDDDTMVNIPVWQAHYLTRYIGSKKTLVKLSRITGSRWNKTKLEAAASVRSLAYEMLRMQAVRAGATGTAFPADDLNQRLFEQAFPFQETADQLRAAEEIKTDMEREKPMDRLLCGDVGYGKTELAMRAAFKAVMGGRQVGVLVPTTVLAQQHYFSFLERFAGTPVIIETLSRFKSKAEQTEIVRRLKAGTVDIVIGTHRMLAEDVRFKDLGLIVIDEEQRFGVVHKERLKRLRTSVDVLTMTATPIPRTLYLSLAGLRDLSTLMSAPVARLPIKTVVAQADDAVIAAAVGRELQRGGQVYYLHNRVQSIDDAAVKLGKMFPQARIGIGHGQMPEEELEETMKKFIEGRLDVLVCTTIIESGLDIPNANTIVIDRADRFGLAELYQLRGRVGRWTRQAYAYFLLPKSGILAGDARKRIDAIRRYTHLGAGFKLALRDLEIRGSGNILGAEQSGQINAVGFHLYCELLKATIAQIQGHPEAKRTECAMDLDFLDYTLTPEAGKLAACFPRDYINADQLRLNAYRRLAGITKMQELEDFALELRDRFGKCPEEAEVLLESKRIRLFAEQSDVDAISCRGEKIIVEKGGLILKQEGRIPRFSAGLTAKMKLETLMRLLVTLFSGK